MLTEAVATCTFVIFGDNLYLYYVKELTMSLVNARSKNFTAVWLFLSLVFGLTITLVIVARLTGFTLEGAPILMSQMAILFAMFIPGIVAILLQKFYLKKSIKDLGFKFGPWPMYLQTYAIILAMFVISYTITWLFIVPPDFTLNSFLAQFVVWNKDLTLPIPAWQMIVFLSLVTFVGAPIMNIIPSLGEEVGWRGFLLPNLESLGKVKALLLSSVIWGLWHTPMILILGFAYGTQKWFGMFIHLALVIGLGIWIGYVYQRTRSVILAGFMHATFNANNYGIWAVLFVSSNKLLVGGVGVINMALCLLLGLYSVIQVRKTDIL